MPPEEVRGPSAYGLTVIAELNSPDYDGRTMVYVDHVRGAGGSYECACNEGALDCGDFPLSNAQVKWLQESKKVTAFLEKVNY